MNYFSMFSGIGGFDLALNRAGHKCIGYSEIDKYAIQTYQKNFGTDVKNYGDATKIRTGELPDFDLLCAGFPCQAFSIAGKRRGFKDTRGTLFFEIARVIEAKRPSTILLENVKGLLNHDGGQTFRVILQTLEELGYNNQWMVLNSKFFGVPQNRERVFIIGSLRGQPRPEILPFREDAGEVQDIHGQEVFTNTITARYEGAQGTGSYVVESKLNAQKEMNINPSGRGQSGNVYRSEGVFPALCSGGNNPNRKRDIGYSSGYVFDSENTFKHHRANEIRTHKGSPTLTSNMGTGGNNVPMVMDYRKDEGFRPRKDGKSPSLTSHGNSAGGVPVPMVFDSYNEILKEDQANALKSKINSTNLIAQMKVANCVTPDAYLMTGKRKRINGKAVLTSAHERRLRRLTPIECERLQGFPDNWTKYGSSFKQVQVVGNIWENVKFQGVIAKSLIENQGFVLNTTNDGKNGETRLLLTQRKEGTKSRAKLKIALEILTAKDSVCDITSRGKDMVMLYTQNETSKTEILTNKKNISDKMEENSIYPLLRINSNANSKKERLFITSILKKGIIDPKIFLFVKTGKPITNAIILWNLSPRNFSKKESLDLVMENITLTSDTQRYKQLGNAVTVNVIKAIMEVFAVAIKHATDKNQQKL